MESLPLYTAQLDSVNCRYKFNVFTYCILGCWNPCGYIGRTDPMWTADPGQYFVSVLVSTVPLILFVVIVLLFLYWLSILFGLSTYCFHLIVWVGKGMDHLRILHRKLLIWEVRSPCTYMSKNSNQQTAVFHPTEASRHSKNSQSAPITTTK